MDGFFGDWQAVDPAYIDSYGDQTSGNLDFGELYITNNEDYLFLCIEVVDEINIQDNNAITLYLDADNNPATGIFINNIGAELKWTFGQKSGYFVFANDSTTIYHDDLAIVTAPTISSDIFEIKIDLDAVPDGIHSLFSGDDMKVQFVDHGTGGDYIPDIGDIIEYAIDHTSLPSLEELSIPKAEADHIRLLSYNVLFSSIFNPFLQPNYDRILNALQPDIICFQEIYDQTAVQTQSLVTDMLGGDWFSAKVNPDIIIVSRYSIDQYFNIDGNGAFLLDLPAVYDGDLFIINAHLPSGGQNQARQNEIDHIMSFIREAKEPGGVLELEENTPFIITGDLNLVGYAQQWETLLTGDIQNNSLYGPDFAPDWDDSDLRDPVPMHLEKPLYFTWYNESSAYSPGRLDFMIYSDYVMGLGNKYVLFTPDMDPDTLAAYNLEPDDVVQASDHLPLVADINMEGGSNPLINYGPRPIDFKLSTPFPNPFNHSTRIDFSVESPQKLILRAVDINGREIKILSEGSFNRGTYSVKWNTDKLPSGIYFIELRSEVNVSMKKSVLLK